MPCEIKNVATISLRDWMNAKIFGVECIKVFYFSQLSHVQYIYSKYSKSFFIIEIFYQNKFCEYISF